MANQIKWRKSDAERLSRTVQKFNAKITRISKRYPQIAASQPERVIVKDLREQLKLSDRATFNRTIARLERYLVSGAELPYTTRSGVNTTVWQKKEIDYAIRAINRARKKEITKYEPSRYKGTMHVIDELNLKPRQNRVQHIEPKDFANYTRRVFGQSIGWSDEVKQRVYKERMLRAVEKNFGYDSELYKRIATVRPDLLYWFNFNEPLLAIGFTSDPREDIESIMLSRLDYYEDTMDIT